MRITVVAVTGTLLALTLTACSNDEPTTATPTPAQASEVTASTTTAVVPPSAAPAPASPTPTENTDTDTISGNGLCLDPASPGVVEALAAMSPDDPYWVVDQSDPSALGNCPELLWLIATPGGATASTPEHVVFFHDGRFLGTGTSQPYSYTSVVDSTVDSVSVEYKWLGPDDANCCPTGGPATVTYRWNGESVVMEQPLPQAMLDSYGE